MAITLAGILGDLVKTEGADLDKAKQDLKEIRTNAKGVKASRKLIAPRLRELKAERLAADRQGGGAKSAAITGELNFLRRVLNDMTEEYVMICIQRKNCGLYIKAQTEKVRAIDAEWEKAKVAEAQANANAELADEVANETNNAE